MGDKGMDGLVTSTDGRINLSQCDFGRTRYAYRHWRLDVDKDASTVCVTRWDAKASSRHDADAHAVRVYVNGSTQITRAFIECMPELAKAQGIIRKFSQTR